MLNHYYAEMHYNKKILRMEQFFARIVSKRKVSNQKNA